MLALCITKADIIRCKKCEGLQLTFGFMQVRMMEESLQVKCADEPMLLLGQDMTSLITKRSAHGAAMSIDVYLEKLVDQFMPGAAAAQE